MNRPRSLWCVHRSNQWWETVRSGCMGDKWWKENFRLSRDTFNILCNELRPHISKQRTCLREPIGVEERVAVTLWRLATNVEYI